MEYKNLTLLDEIREQIEKNDALLFYFSTPHCNVCKVIKPKIADLVQSKFPEMKLFYIDIEKAPLVSGQYRIFSIPTILVYFDKKEFLRKSRNIGLAELEKDIERPYRLLFE